MNDPESIEISCIHGRLSFLKGMSILGLLISMERRKCGKKVWRRTERTSQPAKSRNNFYGGIKQPCFQKNVVLDPANSSQHIFSANWPSARACVFVWCQLGCANWPHCWNRVQNRAGGNNSCLCLLGGCKAGGEASLFVNMQSQHLQKQSSSWSCPDPALVLTHGWVIFLPKRATS